MAHDYLMDFFCLTPYEDYLLKDHILSPLSRRNRHHYKYSATPISDKEVRFTFKASHRNCQLVSGSFIYNTRDKYISKITFKGAYGFTKFVITAIMGTKGQLRYWPQRIDIDYSYRYIQNRFIGKAFLTQNYTVIIPRDRIIGAPTKRYDLSRFMTLQRDTTPLRIDSAVIARHRPESLTRNERQIYADTWQKRHAEELASNDTTTIKEEKHSHTPQWLRSLGEMGELLFHSYDFNTSQSSTFSLRSPEVSYSDWRGVTYKQNGELKILLPGESTIRISPRIGYNFRPHLPVWQTRAEYRYMEERNASINIDVSQRGIFGSAAKLSQHKDIDTEHDNSVLFRDMEARLEHSIEIVNGLDFTAGIKYHRRAPHRLDTERRNILGLRKHYTSSAYKMNATFTPQQSYYRIGKKKYDISSRWPTFCLDYERGFANKTLSSISKYERWEVMANKEYNLTPIHKMLWKIGGGMFTKKGNMDFVTYEFFNNGITDYSWNDELSGVFHLLDGKYYNDSYRYLRAHAVIESPMLLLGWFNTYYLRSERLYLSLLATDDLFPYFEVGYGVSTHLIDVSLFTAHLNNAFTKVGVKFTLHIFD